MKRFAILILCILSVGMNYAQTLLQTMTTSDSPNVGKVTFNQDPRFEAIINENKTEAATRTEYVVLSGFRVQIYSGNHPQKSKDAAFQLEKNIKESYPQYRPYVSFVAPFWKVRVGDFSTYYEAFLFSKKLKTIFPDLESEIYVVKDPAVKILYF